MTRDDWNGRKVTASRARWATTLPRPCYLCGKPVLPSNTWVVEHDPPRAWWRAQGIRVIPPSAEVGVSHRLCSNRSGGKTGGARGAHVTNARRAAASPRRLEPRPLRW